MWYSLTHDMPDIDKMIFFDRISSLAGTDNWIVII